MSRLLAYELHVTAASLRVTTGRLRVGRPPSAPLCNRKVLFKLHALQHSEQLPHALELKLLGCLSFVRFGERGGIVPLALKPFIQLLFGEDREHTPPLLHKWAHVRIALAERLESRLSSDE